MSTTISVILGGIITIFVAITVERLRMPRLSLRITAHVDQDYTGQGRPANLARFLLIECINEPLPQLMRWLSRSAALQCQGTITFHHLDGQNVFGRTMPTRWSTSIEPTPLQIIIGQQQGILIDQARLTPDSRVDIYPGEKSDLGVAARFDTDADCFGWSNLSYFSSPLWRNPDFKLGPGRYLVNINVTSASQQVTKLVRLINDVPRSDFRLEEAQPGDRVF